jgi:hypothetical protein
VHLLHLITCQSGRVGFWVGLSVQIPHSCGCVWLCVQPLMACKCLHAFHDGCLAGSRWCVCALLDPCILCHSIGHGMTVMSHDKRSSTTTYIRTTLHQPIAAPPDYLQQVVLDKNHHKRHDSTSMQQVFIHSFVKCPCHPHSHCRRRIASVQNLACCAVSAMPHSHRIVDEYLLSKGVLTVHKQVAGSCRCTGVSWQHRL